MSVRVDVDGEVWTIIIDRPDVKNAVDRDTAKALADAFREFAEDDDSMVAVLWGEGGSFCAGADLKAIAEGRGNRVEPRGDGPMGPTRLFLNKPVIAAIEGHAVGGGFELALWCDLRIMAEDAVLGFFNRQWGVPLVDGGTVRLPRLIGLSRALDLIITGRPVTADEALVIGLAHRVVSPGATREAAEALAWGIAEYPPLALMGDRESAYEQDDLDLAGALLNELEHAQDALEHEMPDGARRFLERRDEE